MYQSYSALADLNYELENDILIGYLNKDYKQNLKKFSNKVNNFLINVLSEKVKFDTDLKLFIL